MQINYIVDGTGYVYDFPKYKPLNLLDVSTFEVEVVKAYTCSFGLVSFRESNETIHETHLTFGISHDFRRNSAIRTKESHQVTFITKQI